MMGVDLFKDYSTIENINPYGFNVQLNTIAFTHIM